jgi:branched-chain amino acid transport system substrate-binding protein
MGDVGMAKVPFIGGDGLSGAEFVKLAGDEANGTYYSFGAPDAMKLPSAQKFVSEYKKRFGVDVGPYSANGYVATQIAIAAIAKAIDAGNGAFPSRATVLANVKATHDFDSPIGRVGFDENGDTTRPILTLKQIEKGQAVTVDQITLSQ